jgi:hypothetical protein
VGTIVGAAARVLVVCLLSTSALEKLRSGDGFRSVLLTLGLRPVRPWWLAVCLGELLVSGFMIAPVPRRLASLSVLGIGLLFAAAGAYALRIKANVECACFGQLGNQHQLGWRQILAVPLWGFLAVGVNLWEPTAPADRISVLYLAILAVLGFYAYLLRRAVVRARADRRALMTPRGVSAASSRLIRLSVPATTLQALGTTNGGVRAAKESG